MRFMHTTGDRGQDRQWDYTEQRLARLEKLIGAGTSNPASTQQVALSVASGVITVQNSDGSSSVQCNTLQADLNAGFSVTANDPLATITRTADTAIPLGPTGTGSAGTGIKSSNDDHQHPTSLLFSNTSVPGGNTVANTVTETAFASSYTFPPNILKVGQIIRVKMFGVYGTGLVAPNFTAKLKLGTTIVLTTGTITAVGSLTNQGWWAEALIIVDTIGAGGTIEAQGYAEYGTAATTGLSVNMLNTATVSIDTTVSQTLTMTAQWSVANASDTITLRQLVISTEWA